MDNKKRVYTIILIICSFISSLLLFIGAVIYGEGVRFFAAIGLFLVGIEHIRRYRKERENSK